MKNKTLWILSLTLILLAGCAPQRELTTEQKRLSGMKTEELPRLLIKGQTSKNEVEKFFGEPRSIKHNEKLETEYFYTVVDSKRSEDYVPMITAPKYSTKIITLKITFEKDCVKNYELSQHSLDSSRMLR